MKNADGFVEQAVRNVGSFCDRLIVSDDGSTDATVAILEELAKEYSHIEWSPLVAARDWQDLIRPHSGNATNIFGIDEDEVYDQTLKIRAAFRVLGG